MTTGTAAVLGRARALPRQAHRGRGDMQVRTRRENLLQPDVVIPFIAEVVGIAQPLPGSTSTSAT